MTTHQPIGPVSPDPDEPIELALTDDAAKELADELAELLGCAHCIGGFLPAGRHLILGLVYTACPHCTDGCRCCNGTGLFPADSTCIHCLADALAAVGYTAQFCHTCAGVTRVDPMHEVTP